MLLFYRDRGRIVGDGCGAGSYDGAVTHYEALGVGPAASPEEVRRAYLRLARDHHPDRHATSASAAESAGRRMRDINAAWAVLGHEGRRAEYDRRLLDPGSTGHGVRGTGDTGAGVHQPSTEFRPRYDRDEDDDDAWRYEPDEFDPATALGRPLGTGPFLLLVLGFALLAVSLVLSAPRVAALGVAVVLVGGVLFVSAPLVAMLRSRSNERRHQSRRPSPGR